MHRPLLRDISFYLVTTTLVWITFLFNEIQLYHSLLFISIYFVYVTVVIVSGIIYRRQNSGGSPANGDLFANSMPRDNLNRANKYKIRFDDSPKTKKSLKDILKKDKNDNYEGVVLRRTFLINQYISFPINTDCVLVKINRAQFHLI